MCKKGICIGVLVLVICIGISVCGTYMVMKKLCDRDAKCPKVKYVYKDCNNLDEDEKQESLDEEEYVYYSNYELILNKINDLSKLEYLNKNFKVEDLSNYELLLVVPGHIENAYSEGFSLEEANKITKEYFGLEVTGEDIWCEENKEIKEFIYDKEKEYFIYNNWVEGDHSGHGKNGKYNPNVLNRVIRMDKKDNLFTVEVKKAFNVPSGHTGYFTDYYRTYADALLSKNALFDIKVGNNEDINEKMESYFAEIEFNNISNSKLVSYTYAFEYKDDNFILKSYSFK